MATLSWPSCVLVLLIATGLWCCNCQQCEVRVSGQPWPDPVYIPTNSSSIQVNCTGDRNPFWLIDLAGDASDRLPFSVRREVLNANGVYELPAVGIPPTLRLLINDSLANNQTVIICDGGTQSYQTTLFVHEPPQFVLDAMDKEGLVQSSNITWSPQNSFINTYESITYKLKVVNTYDDQWIVELRQPYYAFTAPEGALPCEVYNFSITATYVGATYIGDGCSESSPVLSRMLPSLPDIERLESSHNYSLEKNSGKLILTVNFQPATYCEDYPVTYYTLDITIVGVASSGMQFTSLENIITAENLTDNVIYVYQLSASNSVGIISTNFSVKIYTTDVQNATAVATSNINEIQFKCDFIPGSDAQGCMVVLVGELENTTVNLTRKNDSREAISLYQLPYPLSCYHQVFALDIEADGSTGTLQLPVTLDTDIHAAVPLQCSPTDGSQSQSAPVWLISVAVLVPVIVLLTAVICVVVICFIKRRHPRFKSNSGRFSIVTSYSFEGSSPSPSTSASTATYATPNKSKKSKRTKRNAGSGENCEASNELISMTGQLNERVNDTRLIQPISEDNDLDAIILDPDAPTLPPPFQPDTEPPPDYRDVCIEQSSQEMTNESFIGGTTPDHHSGVSVTPPKVDPTYQDISHINEAPTSHVELLASSTPPLTVSSDSASVPNPVSIYQEITDLPKSRVQLDSNEITDDHDHGESPCNYDQDVIRSAPDSATATAPVPIYQEVPDLTQRTPISCNDVTSNSNSIELSNMREISDFTEASDHGMATPQLTSADTITATNPNRLYDEVTQHPRIITPVNFVENTDSHNAQESSTSLLRTDSPPPPTDSSPVPTYASVAPRSTRCRETVNVIEQSPTLELASPSAHVYPAPVQHRDFNGYYFPPGANLIDEWDDYKIPPEGTLV